MRIVLAFILAAVLPTLLLALWYLYGQFQSFDSSDPYIWVRTKNFAIICLAISTTFVLILGVPAYFILKKLNKVSLSRTLGLGFCLAAIPAGIYTWPLDFSGGSSSSSNGVDMIIDGIPTMAGWLQYFQGVVFFGIFGVIAAGAFWIAVPNQKSLSTAEQRGDKP